MDVTGAQELRKRLEEQRHWRLAAAVRDGRQPSTDPDLLELEEVGDGIRLYGREERRRLVEGRPALVVERFVKRLTDGCWEGEILREKVVFLDVDVPRGLTGDPTPAI